MDLEEYSYANIAVTDAYARVNSGGKRMNNTKKAGRRRHGQSYTNGQLNRLVDSLCHPLYKADKSFILLDGFLHGLVEQNPPESVLKFLRYNLPTILDEMKKPARPGKNQCSKGD